MLVWKIDGAVDRVPQIEFKPWCVEAHLEIFRAFPGCIIYFDPEQFQPPCDHRLTPQELGLPEKFKDWWPDQWETIVEVSDSPQKVYLLDAPTGVGKTVVGVGIHRLSGKRCIYITRTKQLQSQIEEDFPNIVKTVKGRENYPCPKHPGDFRLGDPSSYTAANCTDSKEKPCELKDKCPYFLAKKEALASPLAVLNTSYYLTEVNGPGKFSGADLLVVDEVDSLEDELMNFIQFSVSEKQLGRLGLSLPHDTEDLQAWLDWGDTVRAEILTRIEEHQRQLTLFPEDKWGQPQLSQQKEVTQLESFWRRVSWFVRAFNDTWIFYLKWDEGTGEREWIFKPIFIANYTDGLLWRHATQFLGMSATIFDPHIVAGTLRLQAGQGYYKRLDSPFPVENRPIFYCPVANLTKKTMDTERLKLLPAVQALINHYPNDKILIHTVSYRLRDFLVKNLEQGRLITHTKWNREYKLEEFKDSCEPLVMLSPSFDRGVDLPQENCRCIIICKIPYLYKGDPQIRGRMKAPGGQKWYVLKATQTLVQMSGRAVRSKDDYCDTYILDKQFGRLFGQMKHMKIATGDPILPEWWSAAVVRKEV
ncbi:ATP-dependent DNA helicase DinG [subsurface metagenome]